MNKIQQAKFISQLKSQRDLASEITNFSAHHVFSARVDIFNSKSEVFKAQFDTLKISFDVLKRSTEGHDLLQQYLNMPKEFFIVCDLFYSMMNEERQKYQFLSSLMDSISFIDSPENFNWEKLLLFTLIYMAIEKGLVNSETVFFELIDNGPSYVLNNYIQPAVQTRAAQTPINIEIITDLIVELGESNINVSRSPLICAFNLMHSLSE